MFYPSTNEITPCPRKVQLCGIGNRYIDGGLACLTIDCFGYKITKKEKALQENLCTHLGYLPNACVKKF